MSWAQIKNKNFPVAARNPATIPAALAQVAKMPPHMAVVVLAGQAFLAGQMMAQLALKGTLFYRYKSFAEDVPDAQMKANAILIGVHNDVLALKPGAVRGDR